MIDTGVLEIQKAIVHQVPTKRSGLSPDYADDVSPLDTEVRNYFREKINDIVSACGIDVVFEVHEDASEPPLIASIVAQRLKAPSDGFVEASRTMAERLYEVQTRSKSNGLAAVLEGVAAKVPWLAVLKLEMEQGLRLHMDESEGRRHFNFHHLRDIFLGQHTKLFKLGIFFPERGCPIGVAGVVADYQNSRSGQPKVADFFLSIYLGCQRRDAPDVTTRRFFDGVQTYINKVVEDPGKKAQYEIALLAAMSSRQPSINPSDFARDNLAAEDRQPMMDLLRDQGAPVRVFTKDIDLIRSQLGRARFDFQKEISLYVAPDLVQDGTVQIVTGDHGMTRVSFEDVLREARGKGR